MMLHFLFPADGVGIRNAHVKLAREYRNSSSITDDFFDALLLETLYEKIEKKGLMIDDVDSFIYDNMKDATKKFRKEMKDAA